MKIVYSDSHRQHAPKYEFSGGELTPYPECPQRAEIILQALGQSGLAEIAPPQPYQDSILTSAHANDYLHFLRHAHASQRATGQHQVVRRALNYLRL